MMTQQDAEDILCEYTRAFDRDDAFAISAIQDTLSARMRQSTPQPNVVAWLIEFGEGVLDQLNWWKKHPEIPRPTPQPCEPFTPFMETQLMSVAERVKKEERIERQRQKLIEKGLLV